MFLSVSPTQMSIKRSQPDSLIPLNDRANSFVTRFALQVKIHTHYLFIYFFKQASKYVIASIEGKGSASKVII